MSYDPEILELEKNLGFITCLVVPSKIAVFHENRRICPVLDVSENAYEPPGGIY